MGANGRRYVAEPAPYLRHPQPLLAGSGLAVADSFSAGQLGAAGRRAAVLAGSAAGCVAAYTYERITGSGGRAGADGGVGLGLAAGGRSSGVARAGRQQMAAVAGYAAGRRALLVCPVSAVGHGGLGQRISDGRRRRGDYGALCCGTASRVAVPGMACALCVSGTDPCRRGAAGIAGGDQFPGRRGLSSNLAPAGKPA